MKKLIAIMTIVFASFMASSAQTVQTQNQFVVAYNFARADVKFERPNFRFDENTDSHGASASYSRFVKGEKGKVGVVGLTAELAANFDTQEASLVTLMGGGIVQARNSSYVRPYARAMAGVARQHVNRRNITDTTDVNFAYDFGAGIDWAVGKNSRYALRTGADYVGTRFGGEHQQTVRLTAGFVF